MPTALPFRTLAPFQKAGRLKNSSALTACSEAETPKPRFTLEPTGLWTEFSFAPSYLRTIDAAEPKQSSTARHEVTAQFTGEVLKLLQALTRGPLKRVEVHANLNLQS